MDGLPSSPPPLPAKSVVNDRYLRIPADWCRHIPDITFAAMNVVVERQATRASQTPALRKLARAP
jgi:hypothetical protein